MKRIASSYYLGPARRFFRALQKLMRLIPALDDTDYEKTKTQSVALTESGVEKIENCF